MQQPTLKETVDVVQHKATNQNQSNSKITELPVTTAVSKVQSSPKVGWAKPPTLPNSNIKLKPDIPRIKVEVASPPKLCAAKMLDQINQMQV